MSAWIAAAVPADANRYSTCADRVSRTTVGSTHASAVAVTEFAIPTTVSVCPPGSVMVGAERAGDGARGGGVRTHAAAPVHAGVHLVHRTRRDEHGLYRVR